MMLIAKAVHCSLDGRVEQLHHQHQNQAADKKGPLSTRVSQPETERGKYQRQGRLLAEGGLVTESGPQPLPGVAAGPHDAHEAGIPGFTHICSHMQPCVYGASDGEPMHERNVAAATS